MARRMDLRWLGSSAYARRPSCGCTGTIQPSWPSAIEGRAPAVVRGRADEWIVYGLVVVFAAWIIVMPLDARRYRWLQPVPAWLQPIGALLLLLAAFFLYRSFADNPFLSGLVRVQREREHRVVSTGVYRVVRHPMYLGATCMCIGAPLFLRSTAGVLVGGALSLILVGRIVLEERLLSRDLEGYDAYRSSGACHRLIPLLVTREALVRLPTE